MALWAELQNDHELVAAAGRLRASERKHQERPIHGDLRLDHFHLHNGKLCVLDWEEFGLGDPARDLGMLAGEWIYRAVLDTVTTRGGASAPPARFDDDSASARIAERMAAIVPSIRRMWTSYADHANYHDPDLPVRATAHLGWHLVDRTITMAPMVSRLPGIERAAAGVGREALSNSPQSRTPACCRWGAAWSEIRWTAAIRPALDGVTGLAGASKGRWGYGR